MNNGSFNSDFAFRLGQAIFSEYSGNWDEGLAIASVILNRLWLINNFKSELSDREIRQLGLGPRGGGLQDVLGAGGFPEYGSNGELRGAALTRWNRMLNSANTTGDCVLAKQAFEIAGAAIIGEPGGDPFASQGGGWFFILGRTAPPSRRLCLECVLLGSLGESPQGRHWFYTFPYWKYTNSSRF